VLDSKIEEMSSGARCAGCSKLIQGTTLQALNKDWHPECFVCSKCGISIHSQETTAFSTKGDNIYCLSCAHLAKTTTSEAKAPGVPYWTCVGCQKKGDSKYLVVDGSKYHPGCFKCFHCETVLSGSFMRVEGKPSCASCGDRLVKKPAPVVVGKTPGKMVQGIRFDHVNQKAYKVTGASTLGNNSGGGSSSPAAGGVEGGAKFCTACGTERSPGGKFCSKCGDKF